MGTRPGPEETRPLLSEWGGLLRRRWRSGLVVAGVVLGASAAVLLLTRPIHRAEARLRLGEPPPMGGVSPSSGLVDLFRMGGDPFANDMELFESRTLAEGVVESVALNAELIAPRDWHRDSLFTVFRAGRSTEDALFELEWGEAGGIAVRRLEPRDSLIGALVVGQPHSFGGITVAARRRGDGPAVVRIRTLPFDEAVRRAGSRVVVERTRRDANVMEVRFDAADPGVAREAVQAALGTFVALRTAIQHRESGETVDSLQTVVVSMRGELVDAEQRLESLQREVRLVAPAVQSAAFIERYSEAVGRLEQARSERDAVASVLRRSHEGSDRAEAWTSLVAHPAFLQNETIGKLLGDLIVLERERRRLATRRTAGNREYELLVEQIEQLDTTLRSLAGNYERSLVERIAGLETQVAAMDAVMEAAPAQTLELGRRERTVRLLSELLILTEQRLRQEQIRQALTYANVQVIDPPALLPEPVWPRRGFGGMIGLLLAGVFGGLAMIVRDRADRSVRSAAAVYAAADTPVVAVAASTNGGPPCFAPEELRAILRRAPNGARRFAVVPVDGGDAADRVAAALEAALRAEPQGDGPAPAVEVLRAPDSFAAALAAADSGATLLLAVTPGRTSVDRLGRAARLLREAGGTPAGAILVYPRRRPGPSVWE